MLDFVHRPHAKSKAERQGMIVKVLVFMDEVLELKPNFFGVGVNLNKTHQEAGEKRPVGRILVMVRSFPFNWLLFLLLLVRYGGTRIAVPLPTSGIGLRKQRSDGWQSTTRSAKDRLRSTASRYCASVCALNSFKGDGKPKKIQGLGRY